MGAKKVVVYGRPTGENESIKPILGFILSDIFVRLGILKTFKQNKGVLLFMIGLIVALEAEGEDLKKEMESPKVRTQANMEFYSGFIRGIECVVAQCSPGKVNAAVCAQLMISLYQPKFIINSGIAGGIGSEVRRGDLVISRDVVQHDIDTTALGEPMGLIPGLNQIRILADPHLVDIISATASKIYDGAVHVGTIATGDQFICSDEKSSAISRDFHAIACEMEGGSIGQVCKLNQIPFVVFRTISDHGDSDAAISYTEFTKITAQKSARTLCEILPQLI